jgi:hypothetical protein
VSVETKLGHVGNAELGKNGETNGGGSGEPALNDEEVLQLN